MMPLKYIDEIDHDIYVQIPHVEIVMKDLPYTITTSNKVVEPAKVWCEEKWGKRWSVIDNQKGMWCVFWGGREIPKSYKWYFQNEQDAILFSLRWS